MLDAAEVSTGMSALEIGPGTGEFTVALARQIGATGSRNGTRAKS
jgi:16S rRNA A1518/A1519 N6-dimethyltransferase RsmA/KsgA/DIM1 with predicted DNA glycosylase/AP lyase activity